VKSRPLPPLTAFVASCLALALLLTAAGAAGAGSVDDELVRIGREIPGFGGLYYDAAGRPNVFLLEPDGAGGAALKRLGPEVRLRRGEYEFERLLGWRLKLRPLLALPGVVFLDADETLNRVVLGLDATARSKGVDRGRVEEEILAEGVPRQAVLLVETSPIQELAGLQSSLRPVPGGMQIVFPIAPPTYGVCTLGFNGRLDNVLGFVTNAHCTGSRGEVDGIRYFQSTPSGGAAAVATEAVDPGFSTAPPCPSGRRCRFSDAAFARYDNPKHGALGKIARPVSGGSELGALTLKPTGARFSVTGRAGSLLAGDVVHKVGRTTGWTFGSVVATCADINSGGTDVTQFCQSVVRSGSGGGDSGSPVFQRIGKGTKVKLAGILWGGGFSAQFGGEIYVFSPLANIEQELGALKVN
jgi:hypothetical protein